MWGTILEVIFRLFDRRVCDNIFPKVDELLYNVQTMSNVSWVLKFSKEPFEELGLMENCEKETHFFIHSVVLKGIFYCMLKILKFDCPFPFFIRHFENKNLLKLPKKISMNRAK